MTIQRNDAKSLIGPLRRLSMDNRKFVSFDIVKLYPQVPVDEMIVLLLERVRNDPDLKSMWYLDGQGVGNLSK